MDTKTIRFGEGNISGVNMPLISFDCIFDIDFGLMVYIYKHCLDPNVFDVEWFLSHKTNQSMISALYLREDINPLTLCLLDKSIADELYKEFMEEEYDAILRYSIPTEMINLIKIFRLSGDIKPSIFCVNEKEMDFLESNRILSDIPKYLLLDLAEHVDVYKQFFFKSLYHEYAYLLSDSIKEKNIYLVNTPYNDNYDKEIDIKTTETLLRLIMERNYFHLFDMYDREKLLGGITT